MLSPVAAPGVADHLVAFEVLEGARRLHFLAPGGRLIVNRRMIPPMPVLIGQWGRPSGFEAALSYEGAVFVDADAVACEIGSPRSGNVVLLGALSVGLPFEARDWRDVIEGRVPPSTVDGNLAAFERGREACREG